MRATRPPEERPGGDTPGVSVTVVPAPPAHLHAAGSESARPASPAHTTFEAFVADHFTALARYAAVLTGDRQQAHDVLAEALVTAQVRWSRIAPMDHPLAYVRRIVTSTFLSERRRWSVRHIRVTASGEMPEVALPDPTDAVDEREHLAALLSALPPRQRAAVVLRFYLGLDAAAVAAELGITAGAARTALSRGLAALRIAEGAERSAYDEPAGVRATAPPAADTPSRATPPARAELQSPEES